jgi:hypothetical protein
MGDSHVRKNLIPEEAPAKPDGKSKSKSKDAASDGSGKARVIAITSVFVVLLAIVTYMYAWPDSTPKDEPGEAAPPPDPAQPIKPQDNTPVPPEMKPDRHDVIQG